MWWERKKRRESLLSEHVVDFVCIPSDLQQRTPRTRQHWRTGPHGIRVCHTTRLTDWTTWIWDWLCHDIDELDRMELRLVQVVVPQYRQTGPHGIGVVTPPHVQTEPHGIGVDYATTMMDLTAWNWGSLRHGIDDLDRTGSGTHGPGIPKWKSGWVVTLVRWRRLWIAQSASDHKVHIAKEAIKEPGGCVTPCWTGGGYWESFWQLIRSYLAHCISYQHLHRLCLTAEQWQK